MVKLLEYICSSIYVVIIDQLVKLADGKLAHFFVGGLFAGSVQNLIPACEFAS
ncbi:hypothetical protein LZ463_24775 [Undibacterium sp. TS12]|nr:hypothetical protein [Undibacterium sp. TS12]MCH8622323.1 hypothetical protein [Undibacterium sp. TS12]